MWQQEDTCQMPIERDRENNNTDNINKLKIKRLNDWNK